MLEDGALRISREGGRTRYAVELSCGAVARDVDRHDVVTRSEHQHMWGGGLSVGSAGANGTFAERIVL